MNDHKEHISHYSTADIQRYVQGKLSAREMHAMEKAALDDPFLADAIEGMQQALTDHPESLVTGQFQQLQQQFQTRTAATGKVVSFKPFRYWQAAAAASVVIITGVWIYTLVTRPNESSMSPVVAKTEEQKQAPAPVSTLPDSEKNINSTPAQEVTANATTGKTNTFQENKKEVAAATIPAAAPPAEQAPALARQQFDSSKAGAEELKLTDQLADRANGVAITKQETAEKQKAAVTPAAVPETLRSRKESDTKAFDKDRETELITIAKSDSHYNKYKKSTTVNKELSGVIKGQVTDLNNNPVANAYIQITKNNNNIITDKSGFFKIPVTDSVVDVAVNVTGYGTQNFTLQNNLAMNQLQLQPANVTLNKPAAPDVKGKKAAAALNTYPNTMIYEAEPVFGWVAFDQYLEKNKKIPAGSTGTTGNVVVSFQVNKKGTLSDFKIQQSLSKAYDEEAIRLISQGPSWKVLNGRKARVTVMVRF
ncbi:TonB family protein [Niastella caeni]|uniref:TonB family protein n=1 Tax=Niastella caeni TaxID=2569763 RepID=A0A4S8I250_9BACT|nr:TonB family protein [Niastella caeni]THU40644.1 TonB family protein [Niastella caeni]